jgi:hypothetical protein
MNFNFVKKNQEMKRTIQHLSSDDEAPPSKHVKQMQQQQQLPIDCLLNVLLFCNAEQMKYIIPKVSLLWKMMIEQYSTVIWRELCFSEWPMLKTIMSSQSIVFDWKEFFEERVPLVDVRERNGRCNKCILY